MITKNNFQALQFARHFLKLLAPYWYGTFGQIASEQLYKEKKNQYKTQYPPQKWTVESFTKDYGERVFDCIGLAVKGYQFNTNNDFDSDPVYNSKYDVSADDFIKLCTERGPYESMPDIPGLIVYKKGHVGIYLGKIKGKKVVIECKGHKYGTVLTDDTPWTEWGKCPWWTYISVQSWVESLYIAVFGRQADSGGLDYWVSTLKSKGTTPTDVVTFFLNSPELAARNVSDDEFVKILYDVFFQRLPDAAGYKYWIGQLGSGRPRALVVEDFIGTQEWKDMNEYLEYIIK